MNGLLTAISTGTVAFSATNIDDFLMLTLFFSQISTAFRRRHIVVGQYLGFTALVLVSIPGFLGGLILPHRWIGLLGLVPIAMGLNSWLNGESQESQVREDAEVSEPSTLANVLSPQAYSVAAITFANGSDNIGLYVPLFARSHWWSMVVILCVFFLLLGVWCYVADKLSHQRAIADVLTRYSSSFIPFVLIGLGIYIVLESHALTPLALVASCLCLMGLVKDYERVHSA